MPDHNYFYLAYARTLRGNTKYYMIDPVSPSLKLEKRVLQNTFSNTWSNTTQECF